MSDIDLKALRRDANYAHQVLISDEVVIGVQMLIGLLDRLESAERRAEEAEKERDALGRDASRYQWLRKEFRAGSLDMGGGHSWSARGAINRMRGPSFDAAVDEEMAREGGAETAPKPAHRGVDAGFEGGAEKPAPMSVYGWAVTGLAEPFFGEFAEHDARAEAKRVGGTAVAFPLFRGVAQEGGK